MQVNEQPISSLTIDTAIAPHSPSATAKEQLQCSCTESKLLKSEKLWRDIFDSFFTFVGAIAPDGILLEVNRAAVEIGALKLEDVLGKPFAQTYWWSYSPSIQAQIQAAIEQAREGERVRFDIQARTKSDRLMTMDFSLNPVFDASGQLSYLLASGIDMTERKQAQMAKERHLAAVEAAIDGIAILNQDSEYLYLNKAHVQLFGYDGAEDLIGKTWRELYETDEISRFERDIFPILQQQGRWRGEATAKKRDGSTFMEEVTLTFTEDGSLICVCRDISDRKQAEQRLLVQHTVTRVLAESDTLSEATPKILQAICESLEWELGELWSEDQQAHVLRCDETWHLPSVEVQEFEALTQQIAFSPGVGLPGRIWASGEPDWIADVVNHANFYRTEIATKVGLHGAFGVPIKSGDEKLGVIIFFSCKIQQPDADLLEMMAAIGSQIGQFIKRKQAEKALRESEERFRSLCASSPVGIFQTDVEGRCLYTNPRWQEITGLTLEASLGDGWISAIHPEDCQAVFTEWEKCIREGREFSFEFRFLTPQKDVRWVHALSVAILSDRGEVVGYVGTDEDITSRKHAEEELRKALLREKELNELKSRFITMTSHEFRTPLTTILGSTELLKHYSKTWTNEKKLLYFDRIQSSVQHMLQMLDDVLFLGKTGAGKLDFQPEKLDLGQFCGNLVEEWQHSAGYKHKLVFTEPSQCREAYMDEKLLMQILGNLLSNAIKYSPLGSAICLKLACENEAAVFQIRDQGIGIPQADQQHLFEPFHRATNVDQIPGTGLGLAIVKQAVDLHGGKIAVNSQVGVGTTFIVTIPC